MSKTLTTSVAFQDPQGNVLASGVIIFQLNMGAKLISNGEVVNVLKISFTLTSTGLMPAASTIIANDELMPTGTMYVVTIFNSNGLLVRGPENWILSGNSPIDISTITSVGVPDPGLGSPVLQNPSAAQTITGQSLTLTSSAPLNVASTATFTGNLIPKIMDNVQVVDSTLARGGIDVGDEINKAYAALPANGGEIWVFGKPDGTCYAEATQINFTTSGKPVMLRGWGATKADPLGGGACINYTVTSAGTMILWDNAVANRSLWPASNGITNMTFVNNNVVTQPTGSTSNGVQSGVVNWGMLNTTFTQVSWAGFSSAVVLSNANVANVMFINNSFTGNNIAIDIGHVNGIHIIGGLFNGNGSAIKTETSVGGELQLEGVNFVANVDCINATNSTSTVEAYIANCHFETTTSAASSSHFVLGNINLCMTGGLMEDDASTGATDYFISISNLAQFLEIYGTSFNSPGRTFTNPITVASPVRSKIFATNISPAVLPTATFVGGTGLPAATLFISNGTSAQTQSLNQIEGAIKAPHGIGDAAFVPSSASAVHVSANSATFDLLRLQDTGGTPRTIVLGPGTGGVDFGIRDSVGAKQLFNLTKASPFPVTLPNGVIDLTEVAVPAGNASNDRLWGDSTTHTPSWNNNNNGTSSPTGAWSAANVTPVTVNANVATDQSLMSISVPAGTLNRVGRTLRIWLAGVYSTPAASTTAVVVKVKLGTLTLATWTSTALAGIQATNDQFNVNGWATVQTAGATAAFEAHGNLDIDLGVGNTVADSNFADVNTATVSSIDTTAAQTLLVTIAFTVASGSNSATQRQLILETIN